ncbi:hypothetical protein CNR22_16255 [Sphingobacteriaceae bacterium]|nr:hypothetical protein CNR22_16255 [Sphingobacteriaceae bacterium]
MTKTIKILTVLATIILMSSFTNKNTTEFIGTYGVTASDPAQIKLVLNSDQTFYYQDFSMQDNKISVKGTWTLKGKKVILKGSDSTKKFHSIWTFSANGQVAKSRRGLTFYSLGKLDS